MLEGLAAPAPIAALVAGGLLLFLGRRLFWLFVGVVGFVVAWRFAGAYFDGPAGWLVALAAGLLGAGAAVFVQRLAVGLAGFAAGGLGAVWLAELLDWTPGLPLLLVALIGGALGAALVGWLFELGLVALSALVGGALVVEGLGLAESPAPLLLILALVGGVAQLASRDRGRSRDDE